MVVEPEVEKLPLSLAADGCVGGTDGFKALITLSIESGDDGSLESLSKSSVSGLNSSNDKDFGTAGGITTAVPPDASVVWRRIIGKFMFFLNFGIGGRSRICCRVIFGGFFDFVDVTAGVVVVVVIVLLVVVGVSGAGLYLFCYRIGR